MDFCPKLQKIRFPDQYPIFYNSKNIFKPIKSSKNLHSNNEPFEARVKKFKSDPSKQKRVHKTSNMMTNKVIVQKSGGYQATVKKENQPQNQHSSNQKNSLLNKLSQQFKLKFNSASVSKSESTESEKRKTLDANQLASSIGKFFFSIF